MAPPHSTGCQTRIKVYHHFRWHSELSSLKVASAFTIGIACENGNGNCFLHPVARLDMIPVQCTNVITRLAATAARACSASDWQTAYQSLVSAEV